MYFIHMNVYTLCVLIWLCFYQFTSVFSCVAYQECVCPVMMHLVVCMTYYGIISDLLF